MLKELQNSISVKTLNLKQVKNAALLGMILFTTNVSAENFYNDYANQDLADYVSKKVQIFDKFKEVKIREKLGCKTGDLRAELGGILRHVNLKGHKLDITEENYAQTVDELTSSKKYKESGICGEQRTEEFKEKLPEVKDFLSKKEIKLETKKRNFEMPKQIRNLNLSNEVREKDIIKPTVRKGLKM